MASEWVGVVGTAIGAGIGGVVTVVSLVVKGRQDASAERRRADREDQARRSEQLWTVKLQNVEDRRALYTRLLASAQDLTTSIHNVIRHAGPDDRNRAYQNSNIPNVLKAYMDAVAETKLVAVESGVCAAADELLALADELCWDIHWHQAEDEVLAPKLLQLNGLVPDLQEACRVDLGLAVEPKALEP